MRTFHVNEKVVGKCKKLFNIDFHFSISPQQRNFFCHNKMKNFTWKLTFFPFPFSLAEHFHFMIRPRKTFFFFVAGSDKYFIDIFLQPNDVIYHTINCSWREGEGNERKYLQQARNYYEIFLPFRLHQQPSSHNIVLYVVIKHFCRLTAAL